MTTPWYTYPRIDNIGQPDPFGGFPKPDSNIEVPLDTPMTAPASGVITDINDISAWGDAITVRFDTSPNSQATHFVFLHLNSIAPNISVGQHVNAGDILGYSGPNPQNAAPGFALYPGDAYGTDNTWAGYDTVPNVTGAFNPVPYLDNLQQGTTSTCVTQCLQQHPDWTLAQCQALCGNSTSPSNPLDAIGNFLNSIQGITGWLGNPLRIIKMVAGIALVVGSLFLFAREQGGIQHG